MKLLRREQWLNGLAIVFSAVLCFLLSFTRIPGMELLGIGPNWVLIWVVVWSLKRKKREGIVAGLVMGLIQDGLTAGYPSHIPGLVLVGWLSARLQKQRYLQEDFISVALIVFAMTIVGETATAIQFGLQGSRSWEDIWRQYQRLVLGSAILSSLWAPVFYYPLNRWWASQKQRGITQDLPPKSPGKI